MAARRLRLHGSFQAILVAISIPRVVCVFLKPSVSQENESRPPVAEKEIICKSDMLCN